MTQVHEIRSTTTIADVLEGRARWCVADGDCVDVMPGMLDKSVDVCITDPPYSAHVHASVRSLKKSSAEDGADFSDRSRRGVELGFEHLDALTRRAASASFARIVKRWTAIFSDEICMPHWRRSLAVYGLEYIRSLYWVRVGSAPQFTGDRPAAGVECITLVHPKGRKRWNGGGKAGVYTFPIVANRGGQTSVRVHETQKPAGLMLALVEDFSDRDEIVFDPFCGSGTTGVASPRLGRRFIGIERRPEHAAVARERLAAETEGMTLQAARAGQVSLFSIGGKS